MENVKLKIAYDCKNLSYKRDYVRATRRLPKHLCSDFFLHVLTDKFLNCFNKRNFLIGGTVLFCHTRQNCLCMNRCDPLSEFVFHFLRFGKMKNYLDGMSLLIQFLLVEYMIWRLSNISISVQKADGFFHIFLSVDLTKILTIELDRHTAFQNTIKDTAFVHIRGLLHIFQWNIGGNDHQFTRQTATVNYIEHTLLAVTGIALGSQIVQDQQVGRMSERMKRSRSSPHRPCIRFTISATAIKPTLTIRSMTALATHPAA